jgi:hypothetical protein
MHLPLAERREICFGHISIKIKKGGRPKAPAPVSFPAAQTATGFFRTLSSAAVTIVPAIIATI